MFGWHNFFTQKNPYEKNLISHMDSFLYKKVYLGHKC